MEDHVEAESYDYYEAMFGSQDTQSNKPSLFEDNLQESRKSYESVWGPGSTEGSDLKFKGDSKKQPGKF